MKKVRIVSCPKMTNGGVYYGIGAPNGEVLNQDTANSMANPSNPNYKERGNGMFSVDNYSGNWYHPNSTAGYTDQPLNTDYTGFSGIGAGNTGYQPTQRGTAMTQSANSHTNEDADYSIDAVRSQYGGPRKVRITGTPTMAYGGAKPQTVNGQSTNTGSNVFDSRWNPMTFQGMAGVNPDPDPYAKTGKTIQKDPVIQKDYNVGSEYDIDPKDLHKLTAMGYDFEVA